MIRVICEPRVVVNTWKEFCQTKPPFSMALDGYVPDRPRFNRKGPWANFNHHERVNRLATRSTTGQIYIAIKQGLFATFHKDGEPEANVYVNDPDNDVDASVWLLKNHQRIIGIKSEPLITRFVAVVDFLDTTAGTYPLPPDFSIRMELAWIFEPYNESRRSGKLQQLNAVEMEGLIELVCGRISDYTIGKGGKIKLDTRYENLKLGNGWRLVKEIGAEAKSQMAIDGVTAFVSVREATDNCYRYTIGKLSHFVPFPVKALYEALNEAEKIAPESADRWGGGDTIGGSPRQAGSKLNPDEVFAIVEETLKKLG